MWLCWISPLFGCNVNGRNVCLSWDSQRESLDYRCNKWWKGMNKETTKWFFLFPSGFRKKGKYSQACRLPVWLCSSLFQRTFSTRERLLNPQICMRNLESEWSWRVAKRLCTSLTIFVIYATTNAKRLNVVIWWWWYSVFFTVLSSHLHLFVHLSLELKRKMEERKRLNISDTCQTAAAFIHMHLLR